MRGDCHLDEEISVQHERSMQPLLLPTKPSYGTQEVSKTGDGALSREEDT